MTADPLEERAKRAKTRIGGLLKEKWHLEAVLGVGGMAAVYLATHRNNGKRVAVKMLHPELSVVPQVKTRFLREGYASNKVNHPGVVSIVDDDTSEDGCVYLVMELLEGENLEQRRVASGGRLDLQEVLWVVDQLLDVLIAAHNVGVIHRDIKPENLFLTSSAALKVLDFGLARVRDPKNAAGLTRTNMLMGTLDFMPPEQARGKWDGVGAQSDIWSVGATMFMLLTGHPVHEEQSLEAQLKVVATRPPRSIRTLRPDLPEPVIALIDRALAFSPRDRWVDAFSMQEAVRDVYNKLGGEQVPGTLRPPPVETSASASASPSWESDLAQTQAISQIRFEEKAHFETPTPFEAKARFEDDAVTKALPPSLSSGFLQHPKAAPPPVVPPVPPAPLPPPVPQAAPEPPEDAQYIDDLPTTSTSDPLPHLPPPVPLASGPAPAVLSPDPASVPPPQPPAPASPPKDRRHLLLVLLSLPVWLLLFWGLSSLRSCGQPTPEQTAPPASAPPAEPAPSASVPVEPPAPSASTPAAPASSSPKKTRPPRYIPRRKK